MTAEAQAAHLSEGIREVFPDVSLHRFLLVLKKTHVNPEHMG